MDMEWVKDGIDNRLFIVQARPETVHLMQRVGTFEEYSVSAKGKTPTTGCSVGDATMVGNVRIIKSAADIDDFIGARYW